MKINHCRKCEYSYRFSSQDGCWFIGCKYPPFRGRWVVQIKECPKDKAHPTEKGGVE